METVLIVIVAFLVVLIVIGLFAFRQSHAGTLRRLDECEKTFREQLGEARDRENEAKDKLAITDRRLTEMSNELKSALEEKGRYQSEASRVEEARKTVLEKDASIQQLNSKITELESAKAAALRDVEAANQRAIDMIAKEKEAQGAIVKAKDEQIAKLNEFIGKAREALSTEFKALSADALSNVSAQLIKTADTLIEKHGEKTALDVKLHQAQIQTMLKPVEETIQRLDKHVADSDTDRKKAEAVFDEQVNRLAGASESLTNALSKPVVRGSWGESKLEEILLAEGMQPDIDFVLQHSTEAEDGTQRTDAVINLPKGRKLVIDSKNLMATYRVLMAAQDEQEKETLSAAHSKSLRNHIKSLSTKEYWRRYEGLDCVVLFIPHDGMYHAAIRDELDLIRDAREKRVFIANPMTLIPLLKAISYVMDQERLNESAEEIKKVGQELYEELTRFAGNITNVGEKLRATVKAYNDSIPGLDRFIVAKSRKLKQLGSAKGPEAELPEEVDLEPRPFGSRELRQVNLLLDGQVEAASAPFALTANAEDAAAEE